jgi:hypothetical protein
VWAFQAKGGFGQADHHLRFDRLSHRRWQVSVLCRGLLRASESGEDEEHEQEGSRNGSRSNDAARDCVRALLAVPQPNLVIPDTVHLSGSPLPRDAERVSLRCERTRNSPTGSALQWTHYSYVRFVDITNLFNGQEMCAPASYLFAGYSKFGTTTAGHPTAQGHTLIADAIMQLCATLPRRCIGSS